MKAESSASENAAIFLQSNLMRHLLLTGQAGASMHALARMKGALLCSEFLQPYFTRAEQHLDLYGEMQTPCATCELRVDSSTRQQSFTHDKPSGTISVIVLCGGRVWLKAYHNCWSCPAVSADIHRWLLTKLFVLLQFPSTLMQMRDSTQQMTLSFSWAPCSRQPALSILCWTIPRLLRDHAPQHTH